MKDEKGKKPNLCFYTTYNMEERKRKLNDEKSSRKGSIKTFFENL